MKNVLIVDDEQYILSSLKEYLEEVEENFSISTAENGKVAAEILMTTSIDLVVSDLRMPEMDGFELLAFISTNFPSIPVIIMSAFVSHDIRNQLESKGIYKLLEKPVDFDELARVINKNFIGITDSGSLSGISLPNFMQLIEMEKNTCLMEVAVDNGRIGLLYFNQGTLHDAVFEDLRGEEAVYKMLMYDDVKINFRSLPNKVYKKNIKTDLMSILMEGAMLKDEQKKNRIEQTDRIKSIKKPSTKKSSSKKTGKSNTSLKSKGVPDMADIKEAMEKLRVVNGFMAAGAFSPNGELVADVNISGANLAEMGALANDVLLKAQQATEMMNVGRGQVVHIEAPKAHIICRCLNEATDFSATSAGKAHVHMVLILNKEEGNIAMGKMKLESVIQEVSVFFR